MESIAVLVQDAHLVLGKKNFQIDFFYQTYSNSVIT